MAPRLKRRSLPASFVLRLILGEFFDLISMTFKELNGYAFFFFLWKKVP